MVLTQTQKNLSSVIENIGIACNKSGRALQDITLVAVTKTVPCAQIQEVFECGVNVFGENRVNELKDKYPSFPDAHWHLIGHLQTNKVKYAVGRAELIHSVDSLHLLHTINDYAEKLSLTQKFLFEINISGEESKYGLTIEEIPTIIKEVECLSNVEFAGFMTMAPKAASESDIRRIFARAKALKDEYAPLGARILSMGMSGDYQIAVEEGATHIRVGSAIFK